MLAPMHHTYTSIEEELVYAARVDPAIILDRGGLPRCQAGELPAHAWRVAAGAYNVTTYR
ncbi:hypothetical protein PYJP_18100 [Pyrofollis japonicus]|nr:hypothetical protein PYJP_18100 [Pyrofollis japonicus]